MRFIPLLGAALMMSAPAAVAAAQATTPAAPSAAPSTPAASAAASPSAAPAAAPAAAITAGLPVKDKAGVAIGTVTDVKADASGKQIATIKMGADSFAVDTAALAVDNGSAMINATQAQIKAMLPKK